VKFSIEFGAAIKLETWRSAMNQISVAGRATFTLSTLANPVLALPCCVPEQDTVVGFARERHARFGDYARDREDESIMGEVEDGGIECRGDPNEDLGFSAIPPGKRDSSVFAWTRVSPCLQLRISLIRR
jgi:hypothetical protein